ncbi:MAG: hypothetical protein EZS28_032505 [Streblomastix strix]|uniref:Uncharacterized protein n=1 Tax=Streblomastix strix TaxID=222440 RepID=A0A5J4UNH0_9EUKA|nr:MAG: hypothetical protein EZS28_032505 [Streblomastix strix]
MTASNSYSGPLFESPLIAQVRLSVSYQMKRIQFLSYALFIKLYMKLTYQTLAESCTNLELEYFSLFNAPPPSALFDTNFANSARLSL